jgi:peptidoglycan/LPS O-acetylase OafA/YrhL
MIQRIQTLFLFLIVIVASAGLFMNSYTAEGTSHFVLENNNITIVSSIVSTLALVSIFMYSNRRLQIKLCYGLMLLSLVCEAFIGFDYSKYSPNFNMFLFGFPTITFILAFLAQHFIKKDLKLVESADRLR